jgi:hypothetical protein
MFGFGDASGRRFGLTFQMKAGCLIHVCIGVWSCNESEESSNWREFTNVVETLEEEGQAGNLENCEIYFITDNSTVESVLHNGTSSSLKLLELVIRFSVVQSNYSVIIRVCHFTGTRMIASCGDGISFGQVSEGVMAGAHFGCLHSTPPCGIRTILGIVGLDQVLGWSRFYYP